MSEPERTQRQQMRAEADQLGIEIEGYRYEGRDIAAFGAAFRRLCLELALACRVPELVARANRIAKRVRR